MDFSVDFTHDRCECNMRGKGLECGHAVKVYAAPPLSGSIEYNSVGDGFTLSGDGFSTTVSIPAPTSK